MFGTSGHPFVYLHVGVLRPGDGFVTDALQRLKFIDYVLTQI